MLKDKIEIIITSYKRELLLLGLIKSINKINYPISQVNIILIIDGYKPKIKKIKKISKFKIKFIHNKTNRGPSYSRNIAIKNSKSEFLWFLDSDAKVENYQIITNFLNLIKNTQLDGITGYYEKFENTLFVQNPISPKIKFIEYLLKKKGLSL